MKPIQLEKISLSMFFSKEFVEKYGGKKNIKALLLDIIDRYFDTEYFDPDLVEELLGHK